jgi:hypothetical protein
MFAVEILCKKEKQMAALLGKPLQYYKNKWQGL